MKCTHLLENGVHVVLKIETPQFYCKKGVNFAKKEQMWVPNNFEESPLVHDIISKHFFSLPFAVTINVMTLINKIDL